MAERMSLRRFLRGGYAEIAGPTEVLRRTETVFVATPPARPTRCPVGCDLDPRLHDHASDSGYPPQKVGHLATPGPVRDSAYRKLAARPKA